MSTYVLVHGGGHGGWCFRKVARLLREAGHEVHTPTLTGLGERAHLLSAETDLHTHIADVVNLFFYEDLHDVVLVGHSYGGMVITGVADGAGSRLAKLVYLDAIIPTNGQTVVDAHPPALREVTILQARKDGRVVDGVELVLFPSDDPSAYFGVTDPVDVAWMRPRLTPHPWRCFEQPLVLTNEAAIAAIPHYYIVTTTTTPLRDPVQMAKAQADGRLWEIDTGHDLMITEPVIVAETLTEIACSS